MRKTSLRAAIAGALALTLVGFGATAADAAPANPQPDGSQGTFYVFDENLEPAEASLQFTRSTVLTASPSKTDAFAEILPSDYVTAENLANPGLQVWTFIAATDKVDTGTNGWSAWAQAVAAGPVSGGVYFGNVTLGEMAIGDINKVFTDGGTYRVGVAFTINNGVTVVGKVYRTAHVEPGNTNNYTLDPVVEEPVVEYAPNFSNFAATSGASAVIRNGNLNIDATAAAAGKSVDVWAEGTGKVATVTLDASGKAINTVPAGIVDGTRLAVVENEVEIAWIATSTFAWTEPTDAANAATKVAVANPADGESTVTIPTGIANQTFTAVGWSTPVELGPVTTAANGDAIVDAAALGLGAHTIALFDNTDQIVAWGTFTASSSTTSQTDLTVEALTSNKFSLEGVDTSVNLGAAKRGATTTPVALGAFTVVDDRDLLPGWTLNAAVADFTNASANNDVITKAALGFAPKKVGAPVDGISLGTAQLAGSATYSALLAQGAADSSTLEAGTQFDADLTFAVPASAKKGTYTSTLTLTLASK